MLPLKERAVLAHTIDRFLQFDAALQVVVVLHATLADSWSAFLDWHFGADESPRIHICLGGAERSESVHNGLSHIQQLAGEAKVLVAIHDAVRPFVNERILSEGFALAEEKGNAVATVPVKSSMRIRTATGSEAVDREQFYHVQTLSNFLFGPDFGLLSATRCRGIYRRCKPCRAPWHGDTDVPGQLRQSQNHHARRPHRRRTHLGARRLVKMKRA